ncbi:hypothetical protein Aduo_005991 [Ancylostoma duodenale]
MKVLTIFLLFALLVIYANAQMTDELRAEEEYICTDSSEEAMGRMGMGIRTTYGYGHPWGRPWGGGMWGGGWGYPGGMWG